MSVARITTINFKSKEDADESIKDYSENSDTRIQSQCKFFRFFFTNNSVN